MTSHAEEHINYARVEKAISFLGDNFRQQPDLDIVAEKANLSPFHFQRIFTEWAGISPKRFLQVLTVEFLKGKLAETSNLVEAADRKVAGYSKGMRQRIRLAQSIAHEPAVLILDEPLDFLTSM